MSKAVAYYRTSSATNVGMDKDSLPRQRDAVQSYASARGIQIVEEFYDAAVSGADTVSERAGFSAMIEYASYNDIHTVLIENASRFARDLIVQITGHDFLTARGVDLVPVDSPTHFTDDTPTAKMVRSVLGAVAEFEKNSMVARLRKARDRKSLALGRRCEGNPNWTPVPIEHVKAAQGARARGLSLRAVAKELEAAAGKLYSAKTISSMLTKQVRS